MQVNWKYGRGKEEYKPLLNQKSQVGRRHLWLRANANYDLTFQRPVLAPSSMLTQQIHSSPTQLFCAWPALPCWLVLAFAESTSASTKLPYSIAPTSEAWRLTGQVKFHFPWHSFVSLTVRSVLYGVFFHLFSKYPYAIASVFSFPSYSHLG